MPTTTKNYSGRVGVTNFYYMVLDETDAAVGTAPERIEFLQNMSIEFTQEIARAYGDNRTAEIAVANGPVNVTTQFHNIPQIDQDVIFGAEVVEGVSAYGGDDNPPYVALVCEVTHNDGSSSWLGLPKGKFTRGAEENTTREDSIEFANDSVTGEFMERDLPSYETSKSYIKGMDGKDETTKRDFVFNEIFGVGHPDTIIGA